MDSPIEKITDPSFTSSAKGLMTLFCIGLIHNMIGIKITDSVISIPWFPKIEFINPSRIFDLFIVFVVYAVYRYILHNKPVFRRINAQAMYVGLRDSEDRSIGAWFIYNYILTKPTSYSVSPPTEDRQISNIDIDSYQDTDLPRTETFKLIFNSSFFVNQAESSYVVSQGIEHKAVSNNYWGTFLQQEMKESDFSTKYLPKIRPLKLRILLIIINCIYTLKYMFKNPATFDYVLPIILNFGLIINYLLNTTSFETFNQWVLTH